MNRRMIRSRAILDAVEKRQMSFQYKQRNSYSEVTQPNPRHYMNLTVPLRQYFSGSESRDVLLSTSFTFIFFKYMLHNWHKTDFHKSVHLQLVHRKKSPKF